MVAVVVVAAGCSGCVGKGPIWRSEGRGDFDGVILGTGESRAGVLEPASVSAAWLLPGGEPMLLGDAINDRASDGQWCQKELYR